MKKKRFTESEIALILKEQETGISVKEICRRCGISEATFYNWKNRYGPAEQYDTKRVRELEEENAMLKKMFADLSLDIQILRDAFVRKGLVPPQRNG